MRANVRLRARFIHHAVFPHLPHPDSPQFDALLELLTVREHLELFARIKGVPEARVAGVVAEKVREMDLTIYENKLAGSLSGGNKRKLSVAIAMIGGPELIFLDEPSTGMDPVARRFMWDVISRIATERKKCSIILTTHSMEEAEALCTKIGVMVGGRLRCLGSSQHLKSKFGQGYLAVFKLAPPDAQRLERAVEMRRPLLVAPAGLDAAVAAAAPPTAWRLTAGSVRAACEALGDAARWRMLHPNSTGWAVSAQLKAEGSVDAKHFADWWCGESLGALLHRFVVGEAFAGAELAERQGDFFRYKLPSSSAGGRLSGIFAAIEAKRAELSIQEYSLTQIDLESVFNLLAAQQDEERGAVRGGVSAGGAAAGAGGAKAAEQAGGAEDFDGRSVLVNLSASRSLNAPAPLPGARTPPRSFWNAGAASKRAGASPPGVALLATGSSESYSSLTG